MLFINPETGSTDQNEKTAVLLTARQFRYPPMGKDRKPLPVLWRDPKDDHQPEDGDKQEIRVEEDRQKGKEKGESEQRNPAHEEDNSEDDEESPSKLVQLSSPTRKLVGLDSRITLVLAFSKVCRGDIMVLIILFSDCETADLAPQGRLLSYCISRIWYH